MTTRLFATVLGIECGDSDLTRVGLVLGRFRREDMCPTCSHTMQNLDAAWAWCPRCGTVYDKRGERPRGEVSVCFYEAPMLVERTRSLVAEFYRVAEPRAVFSLLNRLGIIESAYPGGAPERNRHED